MEPADLIEIKESSHGITNEATFPSHIGGADSGPRIFCVLRDTLLGHSAPSFGTYLVQGNGIL